tara:strand:- start:77 stop:370 length:294 start_codon:yes stop_codon:yes gene_type:complete
LIFNFNWGGIYFLPFFRKDKMMKRYDENECIGRFICTLEKELMFANRFSSNEYDIIHKDFSEKHLCNIFITYYLEAYGELDYDHLDAIIYAYEKCDL